MLDGEGWSSTHEFFYVPERRLKKDVKQLTHMEPVTLVFFIVYILQWSRGNRLVALPMSSHRLHL